MKKFITTLFFVFVAAIAFAQMPQKEDPSFMGGDLILFAKWVGTQIQYPEEAGQNGIQGRVLVSFTVKADGSVADVHVIKSIDPALDAEAVRVVSSSPKWTPGRSDGKPVDVSYNIPVNFKAQ